MKLTMQAQAHWNKVTEEQLLLSKSKFLANLFWERWQPSNQIGKRSNKKIRNYQKEYQKSGFAMTIIHRERHPKSYYPLSL